MTVLLAEDEPIIAQDIEYALTECGFYVEQVVEGQDVLGLCLQMQPQIVLLNLKQGRLFDGIALAKTLQSCLRQQVMLITGARPKDVVATKNYDPLLQVLYKPFTLGQLRICLERLVSATSPILP